MNLDTQEWIYRLDYNRTNRNFRLGSTRAMGEGIVVQTCVTTLCIAYGLKLLVKHLAHGLRGLGGALWACHGRGHAFTNPNNYEHHK